MNGIKYGRTTTDEELAGRIKFIGIAKADYHFDNPKQLRHGFACLAVGSTTTFNTGITDIQVRSPGHFSLTVPNVEKAGDVIEWNVVPRPVVSPPDPRAIMPNGQFGDQGPGSRQGHPSYGTPHGKLRFRLNASRFNDLTPSLNHAVSMMMRTQAQGGISDRPLEHLFHEGSLGMNTLRMTPAQVHHLFSFESVIRSDGSAKTGVRHVPARQQHDHGPARQRDLPTERRLGLRKSRANGNGHGTVCRGPQRGPEESA